MRTTSRLPEIKPNSSPFLHHLAVMLIIAVGLLAGAVNSQATSALWTNTAGSTFQDTLAWLPNAVPGPADTGTFNLAGAYTVTLTAPTVVNQLDFTAGPNTNMTVTLSLNGNSLSILKSGSSNPVGFLIGDAQGTDTVYLASSTTAGSGLFVTNSATLRVQLGRNGTGTLIVTNGFVQLGGFGLGNQMVVGGGPGATTRGTLVLSGPNVVWSNNAPLLIGNSSLSYGCSVTISNSAQMTIVGGSISVGAVGCSLNSILLDSGGLLLVATNTSPTTPSATIGTSTGTNNTVTVQGGAIWNHGNRVINIGISGTGNSLIVGASGVVSNASIVNIAAGNSLVLSGGLLRVSVAVTNSAGFITGSGTIVGNTFVTNSGTLSLGAGTSVGTLTFSNNLTLVSGSTTILKLDNSQTGSNDQINIAGTLNEAGTLMVITNGSAPLNIGDQYQLFVGTQAGTFSTINLPPLDPSKLWDTNQLASTGILGVTFMPVVPGIIGPTNQLAAPGATVVISATVTGVPTPGVYWQFNGVNTTDGPQADGSTNSGSATATLTISNAQTNESGTYCLIATNSAGVATNCMALVVTTGCAVAPNVSGISDQTVIQGNNGTFSAAVAGCPQPVLQWYDNAVVIDGATNSTLVLTDVQFALDGHVYSITASNEFGVATTNATLHVIITPAIQTQPQSLVVTNTQTACFSVTSTNGVPAPTYQWSFNGHAISGATNATYCIASASPANAGSYSVTVANSAGSVTSSNATLTVDSVMTATLFPTNGAVNVCYDTPLFITFSQTPVLSGTGKVNIYASGSTNPVDTIDTSLGQLQARTIGGESFNTYPVIITSNTAAIYPHLDVLSSNQQYYVTVDAGLFTDTNLALYAGITTSNGWVLTTKPTGPANPNNVVVAADESGDFATVQGAVDSLPANNTTYTLVNIRNGTYTEIVDTKGKNNITFRGQSRTGTVVGYKNNYNNSGGSTHSRMAFKIYANDLAIENMTVVNTTPQGGSQAEALMIETGAARFILNNAEVDSRQDTILANVNSSQGYFYNSLIQGNYDYIWGGGNLFVTNCEFRTIPTASQYNLAASRTDNGTTPGGWLGPDGRYASNGISFVNCLLTRSSSTVTNITMSDGNGNADGVASWIDCHIDTTSGNGYVTPISSVLSNQILWEYGNSNLDNSASVTFGFLNPLTNGDARLVCASSATCWLYNWVPQLAPNILTNPVSMTVTAGTVATFSVAATGIPDPSYQWLLNGTNVINATANNTTLVISNALAGDAGVYSVIVSNVAGTVTSSNATLTVVGTAPTASFMASPTSGTEPLAVTFTDTSSGSPNITLFWDFGDNSQATNSGGSMFVHTYAAGNYTVTLTASNAFGANSTLESNDLINVVSVFGAWQQQYFGTNNCALCGGNADYTGDGMSNTNKFLAGFNPTNAAAYLHIISVAKSSTDIVVTYLGASGDTNYVPGVQSRTNVLDFTTGGAGGGYSNGGWQDTGQTNILGVGISAAGGEGTGLGTVTNMTDVGGATSGSARYYRIRVLP
jgi:PKD repeat protein